jgi:hypothetical protein
MCMNCVSTAEATAAQAALLTAVFKDPVHRALAHAGLVAPPDPVKREVRTVSFLQALDLDPVEVLGQAAVDRARAWVPQPAPVLWRIPIGSHSRLAVQ